MKLEFRLILTFLYLAIFNSAESQSCLYMTCPENQSINIEAGSCFAVVDYIIPTAVDSCVFADTTFVEFGYTGEVQEFVVPDNVFALNFTIVGASGGHSSVDTQVQMQQIPGEGGSVSGKIDVLPGQTIYVYVGGQGGNSTNAIGGMGGYNGGGFGNFATSFAGGGGGGATDIRLEGTALTDRIAVAGGGGGSSYNYEEGDGGGNGGGLIGQDGFTGSPDTLVIPGGGGSQEEGGVLGEYPGYNSGFPGQLGQGGQGGFVTAGAGGGGGYYGGGGGAWNGGGGGSSYTVETASDVVHIQGGNIGNGSALIYYTENYLFEGELTEGLLPESEFPEGTTTVTYEAMNDNGETVSCSFDITITADTITYSVEGLTVTIDDNDAEYQWYSCEDEELAILEGETGQSFGISDTTENGYYAAVVTNGSCMDTTSCILLNATDISELDLSNQFSLYPNPASDEITLNYPQSGDFDFEVIDLTGKVVLSGAIRNSGEQKVDVSQLVNGVYLVRCSGQASYFETRFLKQ